jgi:hypothetical protein
VINKKAHDVVTIATVTTVSGAIAAGLDSVTLPSSMQAVSFVLDVTAAATDAGDLLDVKVQTMLDGTNWVDVVHFTQVLGNGGAKRFVAKITAGTAETLFADAALAAGTTVRHLFGDEWRVHVTQVDGDNDASFTFTVKACPM